MTIDRPQLTWSKLTPVPVTAYHQRSHSHIAYWNGIGMTRSHALLLVNGNWGISYATPKMKRLAYAEFLRAYEMGGFGDVKWGWEQSADGYISGLVRWICKNNHSFFMELVQQYTAQEALAWFTSDRESIIDD